MSLAGSIEGRGDDIATWALDKNLSLLNPPDVPTNPHGNTIDLAFSDIPFTEATVEDHLVTSSDHFTLSMTIPGLCTPPIPPGKILVFTEDELQRFVEVVELKAPGIPSGVSVPDDLDRLTASLRDALRSAAKAAGRQARKGGRGSPWWTEECAPATATFRRTRRIFPLGFNREVQLAKRGLQRTVRRAKRLYWRDMIDGFSDSSSVFRAVRWMKSSGPFQPPPLQVDG